MARKKTKPAISTRKWTPFKTNNKHGRDGHRKTRMIKLPNSNFWASLRVALRRRVLTRELYLRICNYIKTTSHPLINSPDQNVLVEAGWFDDSRIKQLIHKYLPTVKINKVMKVNNPYIAAMYELKKEEYKSRYKLGRIGLFGKQLEELELFHCTRQSAVTGIVQDNLNWRLVNRARYGLGNCFSNDADYANCHANRRNGENRAFFICKVLVYNKTPGSGCLQIVPNGYDTAIGGPTNKEVYVKFCDNECLPQFVAYCICEDELIRKSKYYRL